MLFTVPTFKFGIRHCRFLDHKIRTEYVSNVKELRKFVVIYILLLDHELQCIAIHL